MNSDVVRALIDQIPEIKELFATENYALGSRYNHSTGRREVVNTEFEIIYKHPTFRKWKEQLVFELYKIEGDPFIEKVLDLLANFGGWDDKSRFEKLETKLYVLKEHLDKYAQNCIDILVEDDIRIPEKEICDKMSRAILKLQRNHNYNADSSEDTMNDYIRDILDESYMIKDQTRQGESENGKDAGEVDIQVCHDGLPVVMIEGIKVSSLERERLNVHINKVLTKYDPNGCPYAFLIIFTSVKRFDTGYKNIFDYFNKYEYPFPKETELADVSTGYGELKHAQIVR